MNPMLLGVLGMSLAAASLGQARPVEGDVRVAKIYDLGALTAGARTDAPQDREAKPEGSEPAGSGGPAVVAQMVRAFVQPALLANEDVQALGERWIVLLARPEQHAWVERYLVAAQRQRNRLLTVQCELFAMPETVFAEMVAPALAQPGKAAAPGSPVILAPGEGTDAFRAALQRDKRCEAVTSPCLTVQPLMPGTIAMLNQTAYVRDFEVEVVKEAFVANPVIDVVQDGLKVEAAATMLQEGIAGVSFQVSVSDLKRPIAEFTTNLGKGNDVKIQLPQLLTTQARAAVELAPGQTVALALPALAGRRHVVLLKVVLSKND